MICGDGCVRSFGSSQLNSQSSTNLCLAIPKSISFFHTCGGAILIFGARPDPKQKDNRESKNFSGPIVVLNHYNPRLFLLDQILVQKLAHPTTKGILFSSLFVCFRLFGLSCPLSFSSRA